MSAWAINVPMVPHARINRVILVNLSVSVSMKYWIRNHVLQTTSPYQSHQSHDNHGMVIATANPDVIICSRSPLKLFNLVEIMSYEMAPHFCSGETYSREKVGQEPRLFHFRRMH